MLYKPTELTIGADISDKKAVALPIMFLRTIIISPSKRRGFALEPFFAFGDIFSFSFFNPPSSLNLINSTLPVRDNSPPTDAIAS